MKGLDSEKSISPGKIIINNINTGRKSSDGKYHIFYNVDLDREIKCACDFNFSNNLDDIFESSKDNNLLHPLVYGCSGEFTYLLGPSTSDFLGPGMVVVDLVAKQEDYEENSAYPLYLKYSEKFHKETISNSAFNYRIMVHSGKKFINKLKPCQALINKIWKRSYNDFNHIDGSFLGYCEGELHGHNLSKLDEILDMEGRDKNMFWWENSIVLKKSFDKLVRSLQIDSAFLKKLKKEQDHNLGL